MAKNEDQQAAAMLRDIENRIVWLGTFFVILRDRTSEGAAKIADEALAEYQQRFPAIQPPD